MVSPDTMVCVAWLCVVETSYNLVFPGTISYKPRTAVAVRSLRPTATHQDNLPGVMGQREDLVMESRVPWMPISLRQVRIKADSERVT